MLFVVETKGKVCQREDVPKDRRNDLKFDGVIGIRRLEDNSEDIVDPEPYIPTAFLNMDMTKINDEENFTDMDIITDDDLIMNMKNNEDGRMRLDVRCGDCTLPKMFHPDPASKCTLAGRMARLDVDGKALMEFELTKRENNIRRKEATR